LDPAALGRWTFYEAVKAGRNSRGLQPFVDTYGYMAIMGGTVFEGETILVLGGFPAHPGCGR